MHLLPCLPTACSLWLVVGCVGLVSAPHSINSISALWEDRRSYEARPPPAQDLLAIISTDPRLQRGQPGGWVQESSQATLFSLLHPESPTSPPALIPSAASLYDVSLDPALFAPRATGGQLTAFRMPSSDPPPSRPVLIPNAAYAEDVSLNSALIPKKAQESQPKSPENVEHNLPSSGSDLIPSAAVTPDASLDSRPISNKSQDQQPRHSASTHSPTSSASTGPPVTSKAPQDGHSDPPASIPNPDPNNVLNPSRHLGLIGTSSLLTRVGKTVNLAEADSGRTKKARIAVPKPPTFEIPQLTPGQSSDGLLSIQPVEKTVRKRTAKRKMRNTRENDIPEIGRIQLYLIKMYEKKFEARSNLKESYVQLRSAKHYYPGLPFAMIHPPKRAPGFILRILVDSDEELVQPTGTMSAHYKHLLKCIYTIHQDELNTLDIPIFVHRLQHEKVFDWLLKEVFEPPSGVPLIGVRMVKQPRWGPNDILGDAQIELVQYLSKYRHDHQAASSTANRLLNMFIETQELYHSAPRRSTEESIEMSTSPDFQERVRFLVRIAGRQPSKFDHLANKRKAKAGRDRLMPRVFKSFETRWDGTHLKSFDLSIHPRLSSVTYFLNDNWGLMRVTRDQERATIKVNEALPMFKKLCLAINHIYFDLRRIIKHWENTQQKREEIFDWLIEIIFSTEGVRVPIIGSIKIKPGLAPWEDKSRGPEEVFTPVQMKLIEFFSKPADSLVLKETAVFILATWYQNHRYAEYRAWTEHSHHKIPNED
ncbi:hypothetical protein Pst134EA_021342 [Puccinia striiformis f. sp. tritici]|uniref:hypothetical protein n=1 Tax=Puccinia striiformis f. sp. tritici TaxID=168172 RepID=UPI0020076D72|nr:hypothetical protein Pst134EA_021342 [Puccinia striiformis f. sp. tritici]KAH9457466.1 hypothetical protein Pst134EA_021342 [Puccinia striiformis f. sp. tritici]